MPYTKTDSRWTKDTNTKPKTIRRKHKAKASRCWICNDFMAMTPNAFTTKEKINKLDCKFVKL